MRLNETFKLMRTQSKAKDKSGKKSRNAAYARESAVSDVIGVMMMLTIVIILAAMVSGFADGNISTQTKAPSANLAVSAPVTDSGVVLIIENRGGDALSSAEIGRAHV